MDSQLTMGEQIVLLALDEEGGTLREPPLRVGLAVSATALLGLTFSGHVVARDGALVAAPLPPPDDPVAAAMAEQVRSHPEAKPQTWLLAVREQALTAAYDGLFAKRLVREEGRRVLGVFGSTRYPVTDAAAAEALRGQLAAVLVDGREPDERTAALIAVLHHAGLRAVMVPDADAAAAEARLAAIDEERGPAAALGEAVRTAVAALTAVIAVSGL
jgi:hypothetical protein